MSKVSKTVTYTTKSGAMSFAGKEAAWDFFTKISSFSGFTKASAPRNVEEAVEYHLTFERSGLEGVYAVIRHVEEMKAAAKHASEIRRSMAALAPRDSHEFRSHFDSTYSGYKWE